MKRQTVPFAPGDTETQIVQTVTYDPAEAWVEVTHNGDTLSMSRENWHSLFRLVAQEIGDAMIGVPGVDYPAGNLKPSQVLAWHKFREDEDQIKQRIQRATNKDIRADSNPDGAPWVGNYFDRPEKIIPERGTLEACEANEHDIVPDIGFNNVVIGDICRVCSKTFLVPPRG